MSTLTEVLFIERCLNLLKPVQKKFERLFFPIDGVMQPIEGKIWKASLTGKKGSGNSWSLAYFEKSYQEAINAAGGVKIFEGRVSQEELDKIKEQATYFGEGGSLDYWNRVVKVYIIRRANEGDIYIQFAGNSATGDLQILQKEAFKQTITMVKADQIQKDLIQKGKSVLYINFDTDKATLKTDGQKAVTEIAKALNADKTLKIAINGYTDNTGNETHNLELSKQRAKTVKEELVKIGVDVSRLSFEGFGQNSPIADNNSEEGKAQNRRVELVSKQ
jgi:outer membrane protein OmpA-like peptidoglycan-associated protein